MAETNFTLHSTDTNNYKLQKTFSGVNPEATSAELVETAKGFNRLTDNTYVGTKRIDKLDCDTEDSGKDTPTLTLDPATLPVSDVGGGNGMEISYSGDADIKDFFVTFDINDTNIVAGVVTISNIPNLWLKKGSTSLEVKPCVITLHTPETDNYKAASVTFTVTA